MFTTFALRGRQPYIARRNALQGNAPLQKPTGRQEPPAATGKS
ncbi:Uncharacterised protein [Pseudomonas aeruginosa]|nr:hypothetical protein IHMA87_03334 [Pseudomonas aeruginosa]VCY57219.1 hypothetical protein BANRA_03093 [Pseudomonas aeruginosa]VFT56428.1 Uncharacterised protein [Pseudomonas aeruginosa]VTM19943.1 Uncharacterised protein [Pseudomonas aeruginosa]VTS62326.1 Uncharacterised protein [Streptococcus dysgalactiae subsp. equisimilis]